jgi:hypothetical protein
MLPDSPATAVLMRCHCAVQDEAMVPEHGDDAAAEAPPPDRKRKSEMTAEERKVQPHFFVGAVVWHA